MHMYLSLLGCYTSYQTFEILGEETRDDKSSYIGNGQLSPVTNRSKITKNNSLRISAGILWFCLFQVRVRETVMNYQLIHLELISLIVR